MWKGRAGQSDGRRAARRRSKNRPASLNQLDDKYDQRDDQEDVNESAQRITGDEAEQPQDQQNYEYCPKHFVALLNSYERMHAGGHTVWRASAKRTNSYRGLRRARFNEFGFAIPGSEAPRPVRSPPRASA
jgi:hypothetical protein